jgi:hypothetical protein
LNEKSDSLLEKTKNDFKLVIDWFESNVVPMASARYPLELAQWRKEIALLRGLLDRPDRLRIAMIGSTGAGKSTFLNAVLGSQVLPVGVMQPCTAFVTLVRHEPGSVYTVEVEFCSREDWAAEVQAFASFLRPGDDEAAGSESESKRLLSAARKRVQAVLGDALSDGITADVLQALPLPDEAERIFAANRVQRHRFEQSADMLNFLRRLIRGESSTWPLVKQVSISGPYECLSGGLELVDLPGLNDPNAARIEVTREFLRTSPFVWLMFPMVRGLTQDIQTILGEEKLLRTLVFSGTYNALSLIGTKCDEIDVDAAPQLGLSEDAGLPEIIREYCRQTESSARDQLVEMVRDLAGMDEGGETLNRMLDMARKIAVHTTSASAYMRLAGISKSRKDYGIEKITETGIPGIHAHLNRIAGEAGAEFSALMASRRLDQLRSEIAFFFRAQATHGSPESAALRARIQAARQSFIGKVEHANHEADHRLSIYRETFVDGLRPMLQSSVEGVRKVCQQWSGTHFMTLKAIVLRDGVFKSPSNGKYFDFNSDLTEPLMGRLPVSWERYFTDQLGRVVDDFAVKVDAAGSAFCEHVRLIIDMGVNRNVSLLDEQLKWFEAKVKLLVQESKARIQVEVTARRSELAASIPLVARNYMIPAYEEAKGESGRGMKERMLGKLEGCAMRSAPKIYDTIQRDLLAGLQDIEALMLGALKSLKMAAEEQACKVADNAGIDIDEAVIDPSIKFLLDRMPESRYESQ